MVGAWGLEPQTSAVSRYSATAGNANNIRAFWRTTASPDQLPDHFPTNLLNTNEELHGNPQCPTPMSQKECIQSPGGRKEE